LSQREARDRAAPTRYYEDGLSGDAGSRAEDEVVLSLDNRWIDIDDPAPS